MIFGRNRLERAICGPLQAPKRPKMAILGSFSQFDAHLAIFYGWNKVELTPKSQDWGNVYVNAQQKTL